MPVYASVDASMNNEAKIFDVEFKETSINICPAILNAIFALLNSIGSIMTVNKFL
jgi:hypothetical protein